MPITDIWQSWSTIATSNSPAGTAIPEIDDELRNIKAEIVKNAVALSGAQTIVGTKTFTNYPILPSGTEPTSDNQAAKKSYVDSVVSTAVSALIPSGTKMVFCQASAPIGWTLDTSINDAVLRVVDTAGGGIGGSWSISGFACDDHVLTVDEIPAHTHGIPIYDHEAPVSSAVSRGSGPTTITVQTNESGGGLGHKHDISSDGNWRPSYVDVIIATKD